MKKAYFLAAFFFCFFPRDALSQSIFFDNDGIEAQTPERMSSISEIFRKYSSPQGDLAQYPVDYLTNSLKENSSADWYPQGYETLRLGGQPATLRDARGNALSISPHQALSVWGSPYGSFSAGCSVCIFATQSGANEANGQAALSGIDPRIGAPAIANGDNAIAPLYIGQANDLTRMVLRIKAFDARGAILEHPLTLAQMASLHHGMYLNTNVRSQDMPEQDIYDHPTNFIYSGIISGWSATRIDIYGWSVLGAGGAQSGKYLKTGIVPDTHRLADGRWTNLDTRSSYQTPMAFVGDPGKYFGENDYIVMDMDRVYGPSASSGVSSYERNEFDMRWRNIHKDHQASFHGYTLSLECDICTASHPYSEDSYGYLVNGPNELPAAYIAQVDGDALEYRGYSTWIPGSGAANPSSVGTHHIMFDFASQLTSNNTLHFGARSYHDLGGINDWRGYDVRLGLGVDGARVRDHFNGGSRMSDLAWNFNGRLGSVCLVEPDGKTRGACLDGDGSMHVPGHVEASDMSTRVVSASTYVESPQYGTDNHHQTLSQIAATQHAEGDRIWCHNCLNHEQAHGQGTGRWIYFDSASVWRNDDGWPAKD